jgi:ferredoxin-NADP reductase
LPMALPGQYVVLRLQPGADRPPLFRSYSLSGPPSTERYRISVKIEPHGAAGTYLKEQVRKGDILEVSSPRGTFILEPGDEPAVLLSAGIGATPVLAMLHALAGSRSTRQIFWLHSARDRQHHPFASEARSLIGKLPNARAHVCYSRPGADDKMGEHFDFAGRLSRFVFDEIGSPRAADVYLCGPSQFMADMKEILAAFGVASQRIHVEIFSGDNSKTPGGIPATHKAPHLPEDEDNTGPLVSFARSGIAAHWNASKYKSILELAEACDVPTLWSCRTGVCHNCESGLVSGTVVYGPEPLEKPATGNLLICCSQPVRDVVIDLGSLTKQGFCEFVWSRISSCSVEPFFPRFSKKQFPIPHAVVRNQQVTFGRVASLLGKEPLFGSICATIVQPELQRFTLPIDALHHRQLGRVLRIWRSKASQTGHYKRVCRDQSGRIRSELPGTCQEAGMHGDSNTIQDES